MSEHLTGFKFINLFYFIIGLCFLVPLRTFAQWSNNPNENTKLVIGTSNPINISAVSDNNGGSFVFWQDKKDGLVNDVYFIHIDNDGKVSFRADGKKVTGLSGSEENPVCVSYMPNSALVLWTDYTFSNSGDIYIQDVQNNGLRLWTENGVRITNTNNHVSDYSLCVNDSGYVFVSYVSKDPSITGAYKIMVQKISRRGNLLFNKGGVDVFNSQDRKNATSIVPDDSSGAFVFWIGTSGNKSMVFAQHINSKGKPTWGIKPENISGPSRSVLTYISKKFEYNYVYIAWQLQKSQKDIYHQIINYNGKNLWPKGGRLVTNLKGSQINPQPFVSDSTIFLSWTNELQKDEDVYLQKFNKVGKPLWKKNGLPVIKFRGNQFGQKIIGDGKGGAIISWIDRRVDSTFANIFIQRINGKGKNVWDSLGLAVSLNYNTPKSYLSLVPDEKGGAIAIFKNTRHKQNNIYGQKIFNSGTYASQIIGFNTQIENDTILVTWYSANELGSTIYILERASKIEPDSTNWVVIDSLQSSGKMKVMQYQFADVPDTTGTLYYRLIQTDTAGNKQMSEISRINYFGISSVIVVAQNTPNPFSDSTTISFYLPKPADVTVDFFNEHINKISEINKSFNAGENHIEFYSQGLKPGIYFYRFKAGNFVSVKKMVLTR